MEQEISTTSGQKMNKMKIKKISNVEYTISNDADRSIYTPSHFGEGWGVAKNILTIK